MSDSCRNLVLVFGDQLSRDLASFDGFDKTRDRVWMAEVEEEATYVWSHKQRLVLFFSAMRHFRDELQEKGIPLSYTALSASGDQPPSFQDVLTRDLRNLRPQKLVCTRPGDHRVLQIVKDTAGRHDIPLEVKPDRFFIAASEDFSRWVEEHKGLVMEYFYRMLRSRHQLLLTGDGDPVGGRWDFDKENRNAFNREGPGDIKPPRSFQPDALTREVIDLVNRRFPGHPGNAEGFDLPLDHGQARVLLRDFIKHRLAGFGPYEDAMWTNRPFLYHSRLSSSMNLHLIRPMDCVEAAVDAYKQGNGPINSVEGFLRQVIGWREFVHGVYWHFMPDYARLNALECEDTDVPKCYWSGETDMNCVAQSMKMLLAHGYAHHIHRLMVFGNLALIAGVHPHSFHRWHMAMYCDAVDWVSLPNTLGMSQFGDDGIMATKPYCASGNYINRMSNFCAPCRYAPRQASGDKACPVTTLYWDFLERHANRFRQNARMALQYKNLDRKTRAERRDVRKRAGEVMDRLFGHGDL